MSDTPNSPNGRLEEFLNKVSEQEWFIQLKNIWSDLDTQKQVTLQITALILLLSFFIGFTFYGAITLQSTQQSFTEKTELLTYLKNIQSEIQTLNRYTRDIQSEENTPAWDGMIKSTLIAQGLSDEQIEIKFQKEASYNEELKEFLYAVQIKNSHLKPLIKGIHALEDQMKPLKVRKVNITSKGNKEPVDAQLYVSGFALLASANPASATAPKSKGK